MKYANKPIKVMATFYPGGKIIPIKFRLDDQVVRIQKILKVHEENTFGSKKVIFTCLQNTSTYEIKYDINSSIWYLSTK